MASPWTQEEDDFLRANYNQGLSTAEIGRKLKRPKGAVIGRANRLKLCRPLERHRAVQKAEAKAKARPLKQKPPRPVSPARAPRAVAPKAEPQKPRLWDLSVALPFEGLRAYSTSRPNQCRYPVPGTETLFCAEPTPVAQSYCTACHKLAYRPATKFERKLSRYVMRQAGFEGRAVYG